MADIIRVKRRAAGGAAGAPASLKMSEIAFNEQDKILYIGFGDDGSGNATSIITIAGEGAVAMLNGDQTIAGVKTFSSFPVTPSAAPSADYDAANKKYVDDSIAGAGGGDPSTAIHAAASKATPVDADEFGLVDSAASFVLKKLTWLNLKATLKTYFDTLYQAAGTYLTAAGAATLTNKTFDANGTGNSISNLEVADFAANVVDNDATLAANSATRIPTQAAVKAFVESIATNLGKRTRVRAATTANITIATALNNGDTLDGVSLVTGDLVLVKNQTTASQNGVYVVGASPARAAEFDTYNEHPGSIIAVAEGTSNADSLWLCTSNDGGTLNTTAIDFSQMRVSGELLAANNLSDLANAGTARTNLGLGTMATQNANSVAITGGTIDGVTIDGGTF